MSEGIARLRAPGLRPSPLVLEPMAHQWRPRGIFSKMRGVAAGLVFGLVAGPAAAQQGDCLPLTRDFRFCAAGTAWQAARWLQGENAHSFELGPFTLEVIAVSSARQGETSDEVLDALLARLDFEAEEDELDVPPVTVLRDRLRAGRLELVRAVQDYAYDEGELLISAVMIGDYGRARLALRLTAEPAVTRDDLDRALREVVALIRPRREI